MIDQNVQLQVFLTEGDASEAVTFYFPGVNVDRNLDKDIRVISFSGQTRVLDLFRQDDLFNLSGIWQDDVTEMEYDGLTSFERQDLLFELCREETSLILSWSSGGTTEVLNAIIHTIDVDQEPGYGDLMGYKIELLIVDVETST